MGMSHVRTSPFYPQSNGELERYHKTIKAECIRPKVALSLEDARNQIDIYIQRYDNEQLHNAIGYIVSKDKLQGNDTQIFKERDQKLEAARDARKQKRFEKRNNIESFKTPIILNNVNQLTQQIQFSISN